MPHLAGWTEVEGGTPHVWNCSTGNCPLFGSYSYSSVDPVSDSNIATYTFSAQDEVWVAFAIHFDVIPDSTFTYLQFWTDAEYQAGAEVLINGEHRVDAADGFTQTAGVATTAVTNSGTYYIKLRTKKGGGADAEMEIWVTDNTEGWGSSESQNDGDYTEQINGFVFYNYYGADSTFIIDKFVVDDSDIPISYFQ
jgi:hypothetical protein